MYANHAEATAAMFRDSATWPHLVLPIKRPNFESAIMLETNGTTARVAFGEGKFGANLFAPKSWTNVQVRNVEELIAAGWVVD